MKKTNLQLLVLCFALIQNASCDSPIPQMQQIVSITVSDIKSGWRVSIMPNGSGSIGYGSNPLDVAAFSEGTFSLQSIYSTLVPKLKEAPKNDDVAVAVRASGATSTTARYINRSEAKPIFAKAQQQSTALDKARFDALVKDHPIDPKAP